MRSGALRRDARTSAEAAICACSAVRSSPAMPPPAPSSAGLRSGTLNDERTPALYALVTMRCCEWPIQTQAMPVLAVRPSRSMSLQARGAVRGAQRSCTPLSGTAMRE